MNKKENDSRDIAVRDSRDADSQTEQNLPARDVQNQPAQKADVDADLTQSVGGNPVSEETDKVVATLLGVVRAKIDDIVYDHDRDTAEGDTRPVALFDIENTWNRPINWRSTLTKFVGDDDYTYQPARVSIDPNRLGPGCHTGQVEIEPGCRARVVTMVEQLPPDVRVGKVVQTIAPPGTDRQRLVFPIGGQEIS